jgi:uncharacterized protein (TIGR00730 family)
MNAARFSVAVYCGSRHGASARYTQAAREIGQTIGRLGGQLVYGGGRVGLMGEVAQACLEADGRVVGVITETLKAREVGHLGLTELHVVQTMHQRKQMMAERADAFIALPGGIGTLEELYEVWTWHQLGHHHKPIGLLNCEGFYDGLLRFMDHTVGQGFLDEAQMRTVLVGTEPVALLKQILNAAGFPSGSYEEI